MPTLYDEFILPIVREDKEYKRLCEIIDELKRKLLDAEEARQNRISIIVAQYMARDSI